MPARTRAKAARAAKQHGHLTEFGELDTTPTSRHLQSPQDAAGENDPVAQAERNGVSKSSVPNQNAFGNPENIDLNNLPQSLLKPVLDDAQKTQVLDIHWSESESASRRSSPVVGEEINDDIWRLDEASLSISNTSPRSMNSPLPDTAPLPVELHPRGSQADSLRGEVAATRPISTIDFSETASTTYRSSPFRTEEASKSMWELDDDSFEEALDSHFENAHNKAQKEDRPRANTVKPSPRSYRQDSLNNNPMSNKMKTVNECSAQITNDNEAERETANEQAKKTNIKTTLNTIINNACDDFDAKLNLQKIASLPQELESAPISDEINYKRKQRIKPTLEFDEATQQVKDPHAAKRTKHRAPRMPIVSALQGTGDVAPSSNSKLARKPKVKQLQSQSCSHAIDPELQKFKTRPVFAKVDKNSIDGNKTAITQKPIADALISVSHPITTTNRKEAEMGFTPNYSEAIILSSDVKESSCAPTPSASSSISPFRDTEGDLSMIDTTATTINSNSLMSTDMRAAKKNINLQPADSKQNKVQINVSGNQSTVANFANPECDVLKHNCENTMACQKSSHDSKNGDPSKDVSQELLREQIRDNKSLPVYLRGQSDQISGIQETQSDKKHSNSQAQQRILQDMPHEQTEKRVVRRQFSVSQQGSPVAVVCDTYPLVTCPEAISVSTADLSQKSQYIALAKRSSGVLDARSRRKPCFGDSSRSDIDILQQYKNVAVVQDNVQPPTKQATVQDTRPHYSNDDSLTPSVLNHEHEAREQFRAKLLNGFQVQSKVPPVALHEPRNNEPDSKASGGDLKRDSTSQTGGVARRMHQMVEVKIFLSYLNLKEGAVKNVAKVYRRQSTKCVDKIHRRFDQERSKLTMLLQHDNSQFNRKIRKIKRTIHGQSKRRQNVAARMTAIMTERRVLYEHASVSLRGLQGEILD